MVVGFDAGDGLIVGQLSPSGLSPPLESTNFDLEERADAKVNLFRLQGVTNKENWCLEGAKEEGNYLWGQFAQRSEPEDFSSVSIDIKLQGRQTCFKVSTLGELVVKAEIAELIERTLPGSIQRIPVTIKGAEDNYEILNVLSKKTWQVLLDWQTNRRQSCQPSADYQASDLPHRHYFTRPGSLQSPKRAVRTTGSHRRPLHPLVHRRAAPSLKRFS